MNILVSGGAGYIGSHTVQALVHDGLQVVVYDNLSTGHRQAVPAEVPLVWGDIRDQEKLTSTIKEYAIDAVIHFASDILVGESMEKPSKYYNNNVVATLALLDGMLASGVKKIVFSSTAAVYGEPAAWPITEDMPLQPTNVYGRTKLMVEQMLADFSRAYQLNYVSLRYFNAAGAAVGGTIGEDHQQETHLIPLVMQTALGRREQIKIYGTDYPTADGTCIRDYIHVTDLADAHVRAVKHLSAGGTSRIYNLGSETGYSVRQIIDQIKNHTGLEFRVEETDRRVGDPAVLVASSAKIQQELGWQANRDLPTIISSAWDWHKEHLWGYDGKR